ncbi:MAG: replication-associated recombination protein A [Anaerorhabdus sp.]
MREPLASRLRPKLLDDIIGQEHLVGKDKILRRFIEENTLCSIIFYGPSGTGKTTMAKCLATELKMSYKNFNAVTGNKKDLDAIFFEANLSGQLIVIIDEIHRLNKAKQDLLLPYIENGEIIIIGATTANPYFAINPAIRSRCQLLQVKKLESTDIIKAINNALKNPDGLKDIAIEDQAAKLIANNSNGDIRFALNLLEICSLTQKDITLENVLEYSKYPNATYFKDDDGYYDILSAFQKSIRGSDVDAALYYLAQLIIAEDLESIERRLLVIAYEDIGLANPACVSRCHQALETAKKVGFPEAKIPLSTAVIDLALSPKSKSAYEAISSAIKEASSTPYEIPEYLKLTPVTLKDDEKYDYNNSKIWHLIQYLPEQIKNKTFYHPANNRYEALLKENLKKLRQTKRSSDIKKLNKQH